MFLCPILLQAWPPIMIYMTPPFWRHGEKRSRRRHERCVVCKPLYGSAYSSFVWRLPGLEYHLVWRVRMLRTPIGRRQSKMSATYWMPCFVADIDRHGMGGECPCCGGTAMRSCFVGHVMRRDNRYSVRCIERRLKVAVTPVEGRGRGVWQYLAMVVLPYEQYVHVVTFER